MASLFLKTPIKSLLRWIFLEHQECSLKLVKLIASEVTLRTGVVEAFIWFKYSAFELFSVDGSCS